MEFSAVGRVPAELAELLGDRHRPAWMARAACRGMDPELWFGEETLCGEAKRICASCPVQETCLVYGLHERHGIWGGLGIRSRRGPARRQRAAERKGRQARCCA